MKIGTVTFHGALNFGSVLQAYALQRVLGNMGHEAYVVDYRARDYEQYLLFQPRHPKVMFSKLRRLHRFLARKASFAEFTRKYLRLTDKSYSWREESDLSEVEGKFDCFICGSDQIWNLDCTWGVVEPYFLSFAGDKRRVAYAPSLAHTSFKPENFEKEKVARLLADFDYLSVREAETLPLFQPLVNRPIDVVLDPTLLLDAADYAEIVSGPLVKDGYIFMYLLRDCPELVASTIAMAKESGKKIAYVSEKDLPIPNSVNLFGIGPSEFLSAIVHADAVMANSFHAVVFSVLFHKPFRVFATDKSGARMRDLLGNLGIGELCVDCENSSAIVDVDWGDVDERLIAMREHSRCYLKEALA